MSFLLGGNGRRRNRATVGASRATVPRSKMAASRLPSTVRAGGGGQVQLQRMTQHRPTHSQLQAQTVKQPGSQLHTGKSANTEQETAVQSVISMEEGKITLFYSCGWTDGSHFSDVIDLSPIDHADTFTFRRPLFSSQSWKT